MPEIETRYYAHHGLAYSSAWPTVEVKEVQGYQCGDQFICPNGGAPYIATCYCTVEEALEAKLHEMERELNHCKVMQGRYEAWFREAGLSLKNAREMRVLGESQEGTADSVDANLDQMHQYPSGTIPGAR
jgi:hypothetical protein